MSELGFSTISLLKTDSWAHELGGRVLNMLNVTSDPVMLDVCCYIFRFASIIPTVKMQASVPPPWPNELKLSRKLP